MNGIEVSCTAAITDDNNWLRLFPVPYRFLDPDKRFRKYQWIEVSVARATKDPRPESFHLNEQSIRIVGAEPSWQARQRHIRPLISQSLCELQRTQQKNGSPTLGIFKPVRINRLVIKSVDPNWNARQTEALNALNQIPLFARPAPAQRLEKIPFEFSYSFQCSDAACNGHNLMCTDWEMGQAYRAWRAEYGSGWEVKFRSRFELEMTSKFNTHFFVGTLHQHPNNWIIVGLYYPPLPMEPAQARLFE
jgi:hypothetical protein